MKRLFDVLIKKLEDVEASFVTIGLGVFALITLLCGVSIINNFIKMIVKIAEIIAGNSVG